MSLSFLSILKLLQINWIAWFFGVGELKAKVTLLGKPAVLGRSWTPVPKNHIPICWSVSKRF